MIPDPAALPDEETKTAGLWQPARMRLVPIVAYFVGFLVFFRGQIFSGFDLNFGARGDARFVVFIHESVFRWLSGAGRDLLSPPFFFNQTKTLGYSDAFLLNQTFYAPIRLIGADPFLAMSLVPPLLSAVGYGFAYRLFRRLGVSVAMATLASLIFTFANNLFLKSTHLQHFAVYFLPVVVYCLVTAVTRLHSRPHQACVLGAGGAALFGLVFSTAYYTAWFFGFDLILFTPGFAWIAWPALRNWSRTGPRRVVALAVVCLLAFIAALVPFGIIYAPVLATGAKRDIAEYLFYAPGLPDLVNVGLRNLVWSPLIRSLGLVTDQRLGFGEVSVAITPVVQLLTLAAASIAADKRFWGNGDSDRIMRAIAIGSTIVCVAFFLVVIKSDGKTLFGLLYAALPGATAIRVGYRGMVVANLFAVAAIAVVFDRVCLTWLQSRMTLRVVAALAAIITLLTLAAVEQVNLASRASLSRAFENARLSNTPKPPDACRSFYVADQPDRQPYEVQIDAMMIALKLNLPTLNGYSGLQPEGWDLYETGKPTYQEKMLRWAAHRGGVAGLCRFVVQRAEWTIVADDVALMALVEKGAARIAFDQTGAFHIVLGTSGNGDSFADDRWSRAEPWGRWTQAKHASIVFILPNDQSAHFSIVLQGLLSRQAPTQSVWIDANGCRVGGGKFDLARDVNRLTISGSIPPDCIRKDGFVTLNINTNRAVTPKDIGINQDTRTLGVGIVEIIIREGVPANRL